MPFMTLQEHIAQAMRSARADNARLINRLRAAGTAAFTLTIAIIAYGIENKAWQPVLVPTSTYFVLALVLMIGSESNPNILRVSRFAIPVFDMPILYAIQTINIEGAMTFGSPPGHVALFSLSLFTLLLMFSALTLNYLQVGLSLVSAVTFQLLLGFHAELGVGPQATAVIVLGFATWICFHAGRNRLKLVESITRTEARRSRLQRYFSPGVGELLEEHDDDDLALGQECDLTVLFTDIRGFTALSDELPGREVVQLLNTYHKRMVEAVFQHGGTLDKYLGDGLMAYFNAPVEQPDHATRAVQCALTMQAAVAAINTERAWHGDCELRVGIGIHSDRAIVGDIGAPHRREFTAIGRAVNIASRLEAMTKELECNVIVSAATADRAPEAFQWRELGEFPIRGSVTPLRLFSPGSGNEPAGPGDLSSVET